jgi:CBS domain-containing protein
MSPRTIAELVHRETPLIRHDEPIETAVERVLEARLPALPVVDDRDRFLGIFGEREFITALFPGYLGQLGSAGFVPSRSTWRSRSARAAASSRCPST